VPNNESKNEFSLGEKKFEREINPTEQGKPIFLKTFKKNLDIFEDDDSPTITMETKSIPETSSDASNSNINEKEFLVNMLRMAYIFNVLRNTLLLDNMQHVNAYDYLNCSIASLREVAELSVWKKYLSFTVRHETVRHEKLNYYFFIDPEDSKYTSVTVESDCPQGLADFMSRCPSVRRNRMLQIRESNIGTIMGNQSAEVARIEKSLFQRMRTDVGTALRNTIQSATSSNNGQSFFSNLFPYRTSSPTSSSARAGGSSKKSRKKRKRGASVLEQVRRNQKQQVQNKKTTKKRRSWTKRF